MRAASRTSSRKIPRLRAVLLLVIAFLCRAAPSAAQEVRAGYAGCYRIVQGSWDPRLQPGFHPPPSHLPPAIQLATAPLEGWPLDDLRGARQARSLSAPGDSSYQFTFWQPLDDDSIQINTPLPFAGFDMKVTRVGVRLMGRVTSFTDVVRENPPSEVSAPVVLEPVDCARAVSAP
jgi:hypothetical protein